MEGIWINGERGKCDKDGGTGTNVIKMEERMIKWEGGARANRQGRN